MVIGAKRTLSATGGSFFYRGPTKMLSLMKLGRGEGGGDSMSFQRAQSIVCFKVAVLE